MELERLVQSLSIQKILRCLKAPQNSFVFQVQGHYSRMHWAPAKDKGKPKSSSIETITEAPAKATCALVRANGKLLTVVRSNARWE